MAFTAEGFVLPKTWIAKDSRKIFLLFLQFVNIVLYEDLTTFLFYIHVI